MSKTWHDRGVEEVFEEVESSRKGLSEEEARRRLEVQGPNELEAADKEHHLRRLLRQFHDVLIYILIIAAGLTAYLGEWIDTAVILAVVMINAAIGFVQEGKAEEALEMIRRMLSPEATVYRDGSRHRIPASELVTGDVVGLESGDQVPADLRLVEVNDLQIEEAVLTGESAAVMKTAEPVDQGALLGDRKSMAYSGTIVARGTARGVVVATAAATEVGQIGEMVADVQKLQTPLLRKIDRFGLVLSAVILAFSAALFSFGWFARDFAVTELFMLVVSLAVAAIPEGLPAIMTITLALGVRYMATNNAIVRRLPAVETLGSVTVICSDKTGTLTRNEMTARKVLTADHEFDILGEGLDLEGSVELDGETTELKNHPALTELARAAALCNDAELRRDEEGQWGVAGEPTEAALVILAARVGLDRRDEIERRPRIDAIPFESERRYMATLHGGDEERFIYLKGAPERVLSLCSRQRVGDEEQPIDLDSWRQRADEVAGGGYRVLAIAARAVDGSTQEISDEELEEEFVLLGMVGLMDPPRAEAIEAVAQVQQAGIEVKMITGDHAETARSIGERMKIGRGRAPITGRELDAANDDEWDRLVREHDVFARTSPEHKLRIVEALQRQGQVVAMTGDGVNDAPALKRADVGVAMGIKGTEATKQAADMVLADDNFATIAHAVHQGRKIYDNLKKTILFLLPTNGAEALMVIAALVLALEHLPITPVQILWVNMITAVTLALALAFEPAEKGVMSRPPRPANEPIVSRYAILRIAAVALLIGVLSLASFFWARSEGLSIEIARTAAINTLVAGQLFYLFSSRFLVDASYTRDGLLGNRVALGAAAALVVMQLIFTYTPPFQLWFGTGPLSAEHWLWVLGAGALVFVVTELEKGLWRRLGRTRRSTRE